MLVQEGVWVERVIAVLQVLLAAVCAVIALGTAINLGFILTRPDSISVANVLIGQLLLIICLAAATTLLVRKARQNFGKGRR